MTADERICRGCDHVGRRKYCYRCGAIMEPIQPDVCPCGKTLDRLDRYCEDCGTITALGLKERMEKQGP